MTLDVRSASILLECVRRGSLGRAAAALNMTQPAITRTLKVLEEGYGVQLFERTTRGVVPTVYGEALLPYAKLIVSEAGNAGDMIDQMRGASRGVVRVGGVSSVMSNVVVAAITATRRSHPDVQFQVVEELEDRLLDALKSGEIDIAISPEPYADDEITLATQDTLHDVVHAYARPGHPLARPAPVPLDELAACDWALPPPGTPIVREWLRRFHALAVEPRLPCIVSRSVGVIKAAVMAGDVLCWMPQPLVAAEEAAGALVRIEAPQMEWARAFRVYRRRKGVMTPSAAILVQAIRDLAPTRP